MTPYISGVLLGNNFPANVRTFNSLKSSTFRNYYFGMMGQWISVNMQIDLESDASGGAYIDPQKVLSYVVDLRRFLDERGLFERKAVLRSFIEKIEIGDDEITIYYTLPLLPDNIRQETVSVLDIISSAPPEGTRTATQYNSRNSF